jgi:hypothetical protein
MYLPGLILALELVVNGRDVEPALLPLLLQLLLCTGLRLNSVILREY